MAIVGRSGVGKTTLLERLLPALQQLDVSAGCVKHASHGFLADRPGKDSYRLAAAGAEAVALISRHQVATFTRRNGDDGRDVSLAAACATLPRGLDLVLAEGFSWEPVPRLVVVAPGEAPRGELLRPGAVLCVVEAPPAEPGTPPVYAPGLVAELARMLAARARVRRLVSASAVSAAVQ